MHDQPWVSTDGTGWANNAVPSSTASAHAASISKLRHDIHHELATIMLLAEVLGTADDVGADSRNRVEQLSREAHWLEELVRVYDEAAERDISRDMSPSSAHSVNPTRVDAIAGEVATALGMTSMAHVEVGLNQTWTDASPLALWRALRNIVQNAFHAAGPAGRVRVKVFGESGWVVAQVDDDGPGFGHGPTGVSSLGLGIVQDFAVDRGGVVEIQDSELGGSCVRLVLPAADVSPRGDELNLVYSRAVEEVAAPIRRGATHANTGL